MSIDRQQMDVDIVCAGFGPATGGFLHKLSQGLMNEDGTPAVQSKVMPGMPPQVICYERADDIGFGVSGVVTRAKGIRESIPDLDHTTIPMATEVTDEKVVYLLDPVGASRRSGMLKFADLGIRAIKGILPFHKQSGIELPYIPPFLRKDEGILMSIGQFNQWVGSQVMGSGVVQVWPGMPVAQPLIEEDAVVGVRLCDQGVDKEGTPGPGFMPGMDIRAALTVIGDGPIGPVGRQVNEHFGMPEGHHQRDWAVGMKMVVDLPESCNLKPGTVLHTLGYPEPEIFGFMYVHPDNVASLGIFVPSWFENPVRATYRYMQHWMQHPYLWQHLEGGTLRSWGAKSLQESGKRGEPHLVGNGYARIGEGSGSTNVLTNSGVDEAWTTGTLLAESVLELLKEDKPFTSEHLEATYVGKRRASWLEEESKVATHARDGFQKGFIRGLVGTALSGMTNGRLNLSTEPRKFHEGVPSFEKYYNGRIDADKINAIREECTAKGSSLHDALMDEAGWPEISFDGKLLISHQDALLLGGKVQAMDGYADHVVMLKPEDCKKCGTQICVEVCSGQAITLNPEGGRPDFDREKCVHCGACLWNCTTPREDNPELANIDFRAGAGGLHSAEN
jgi:electron-transferring-flavoprotein dehydrogenase